MPFDLEDLRRQIRSGNIDFSQEQIAGAFGFEDSDYADFFSEYDPWESEYAQESFQQQWGDQNSLFTLQKEQLGTQKSQALGKLGLQQQGLRNQISGTRRNAGNQLYDLGRQTRSKVAQTGFSTSGAFKSALNRSKDRLYGNYGNQMKQFGIQRQEIGLEREGVKTRYSQGMEQLGMRKGLVKTNLEREQEGYRRDWFEKLTDRAIDLLQSGAEYNDTEYVTTTADTDEEKYGDTYEDEYGTTDEEEDGWWTGNPDKKPNKRTELI